MRSAEVGGYFTLRWFPAPATQILFSGGTLQYIGEERVGTGEYLGGGQITTAARNLRPELPALELLTPGSPADGTVVETAKQLRITDSQGDFLPRVYFLKSQPVPPQILQLH